MGYCARGAKVDYTCEDCGQTIPKGTPYFGVFGKNRKAYHNECVPADLKAKAMGETVEAGEAGEAGETGEAGAEEAPASAPIKKVRGPDGRFVRVA